MTTKNSLSFAEMKKMSSHELREAIWQGMSEQNRQTLAERYGENLELGLTLLAKDYLDGARLNVEYLGVPEDAQYVPFDDHVTIYLLYLFLEEKKKLVKTIEKIIENARDFDDFVHLLKENGVKFEDFINLLKGKLEDDEDGDD